MNWEGFKKIQALPSVLKSDLHPWMGEHELGWKMRFKGSTKLGKGRKTKEKRKVPTTVHLILPLTAYCI